MNGVEARDALASSDGLVRVVKGCIRTADASTLVGMGTVVLPQAGACIGTVF